MLYSVCATLTPSSAVLQFQPLMKATILCSISLKIHEPSVKYEFGTLALDGLAVTMLHRKRDWYSANLPRPLFTVLTVMAHPPTANVLNHHVAI